MCGRYVLSLRFGEIRRVLEEQGMFIDEPVPEPSEPGDEQEEPEEEQDQESQEIQEIQESHGETQSEQPGNAHTSSAFRPTYNLAPGNRGIVCLAQENHARQALDGQTLDDQSVGQSVGHSAYTLQTMKWGLTVHRRHSPTRTVINCRADTVIGGMWTHLVSGHRCVVVAEGFYEWRQAGKERVPYYIRRRDGVPLLLAGLWEAGEAGEAGKKGEPRQPTFAIVTTEANRQMRSLHERMPVIFDTNSAAMQAWLDADTRRKWTDAELQALLRPWPDMDDNDNKSLLIDAVSSDVNKAGQSSPRFIVPVASRANRANIANFFRPPKDAGDKNVEKDGKDTVVSTAEKRKADALSTAAPRTPKKSKTLSPSKKEGSPGHQRITAFFPKSPMK